MKILRGFKLTRGAAIGIDNPKEVSTFIETLLVQNGNFAGSEFEDTMLSINSEVRQHFGALVTITAFDAETGDQADEYSDNLFFEIDATVPSKSLH
jgi:hypothetical protein